MQKSAIIDSVVKESFSVVGKSSPQKANAEIIDIYNQIEKSMNYLKSKKSKIDIAGAMQEFGHLKSILFNGDLQSSPTLILRHEIKTMEKHLKDLKDKIEVRDVLQEIGELFIQAKKLKEEYAL